MVTRVDKFLGGLGADVTSVANVHATQNRITFGGLENPSANAHVIGTLLASTNAIVGATAVTSGHTLDVRGTANTGAITATTIALSADGGVQVPNDGNIGSAGATDAMQISSGGIVTFKDDIKIKDGGTIGSTSDAAAITIAASGQVTFSDVATFSGGLKVPDDGDIGSASVTDAIQISSAGIVTFKDDIKIKDGGTIGVASKADAVTIAADGDTAIAGGLGIAGNTAPVATALSLGTPANVVVRTHAASGAGNVIIGDATAISSHNLDVRGTANTGAITATTITLSADGGVIVPNDGNIGSAGSTAAMQISSGGIVTFVDDIKIKDAGTIGSASDADAISIGADGDVTLTQDLELQHDGATISFGTNDEIVLEHVHDTGLLLKDTGGSPTLQLHDSGESISSDGSKLILTSNSVAFNMPTADGSADQAMVTDGSGALSFATVLTSSDPSTTLAATPDLGSVASGSSQDAFGQNLGGLTETDLLDEPTGSLSTLDAGALS